MPPETTTIHVTRGEQELGAMTVEEARALLEAGLLRPTDSFRTAGSAKWLPLAQLPDATPSPLASATARLTQAVLSAADAVRQGVMSATVTASNTATRQSSELSGAARRLMEDFLPRLREPVARAMANTSHTIETALRDEVFLRKLFGAVYDVLPRPVCRFLAEEQFVAFCLKHRERLLRK